MNWTVELWSSSGDRDAPFMKEPFQLTGIPAIPRKYEEIQIGEWFFVVEEVIYRPDTGTVYVGATARRMSQLAVLAQ